MSARDDGPLRVLVVNWQDRENPNAGGAEAHLHEVFGRMAASGDEVTLLCSGFPGGAPRARVDGIDVHRVGGRHSFALKARPYFRRVLAGGAWDVLVEDLNKIPLFTPRWTDRPILLLVHHLFGATAFQEASWPVAAVTWLSERPLAAVYAGRPVIAVSESTRSDLIARGFAPEAVDVVPNGVDLERYRPDPAVPRFEEPTVLFLGRLKRYKRVDLVVRAVALLRSEGLPVRLLVAGRGDHGPALEALAARSTPEGTVRFLGFVDESEKVELLRRAWVHAFTSPKEGWGISNLEAAACGTATVASDAPGLRDSVVDGETGFLVPHGDVPSVAGRLREIVENPDLRERLGAGARRFAERYSWDRSARRVRRALRDRVADRRGRGIIVE